MYLKVGKGGMDGKAEGKHLKEPRRKRKKEQEKERDGKREEGRQN